MKRFIAVATAMALFGGIIAGCSSDTGKTRETEEPEETEETIFETEAEETSAPAVTDPAPASEVSILYDDIIEMLRLLRSGDADDDTMMDIMEIVSPDFMYVPDDSGIYYAEIDIDGNGVDELIIYEQLVDESGSGHPVIYDAYTVSGGELVHFISGGVRNSYYLASDGSFYNMASSGAAYSGVAHYSYADGVLTTIECYFTEDSDGDVVWYYSTSGLWSDDKTEVESDAASDFFEFDYMFIPNELEV